MKHSRAHSPDPHQKAAAVKRVPLRLATATTAREFAKAVLDARAMALAAANGEAPPGRERRLSIHVLEDPDTGAVLIRAEAVWGEAMLREIAEETRVIQAQVEELREFAATKASR
jgi:hypothetical protein